MDKEPFIMIMAAEESPFSIFVSMVYKLLLPRDKNYITSQL